MALQVFVFQVQMERIEDWASQVAPFRGTGKGQEQAGSHVMGDDQMSGQDERGRGQTPLPTR